MKYYQFIDINIYALLLLSVIYLSIRVRNRDFLQQHGLFILLMAGCAYMITVESLSWAFDGRYGWSIPAVANIFDGLLLMSAPVLPSIWISYIDYQVYRDYKRVLRLGKPYCIPLFISVAMVFTNPWTGVVFSRNTQAYYQREMGAYLIFAMMYIQVFYGLYLLHKHGTVMERRTRWALTMFVVPPLIGGIIQTFTSHILFIWQGATLSILIIFFYIEMRTLQKDHLTGAYNRRQLDDIVSLRIREKRSFSLIMIDLDDFKRVNDTYGHSEGDRALIKTVDLLQQSIRQGDYVTRFAGDEFVLIINSAEPNVVEKVKKRIDKAFNEYNTRNSVGYQIHFSMGTIMVPPGSVKSAEEILMAVDENMYAHKRRVRSKKVEQAT